MGGWLRSMAEGTFKYFTAIIVVQLFFGVGVTLFAYAMPPAGGFDYVQLVTPEHGIDIKNVGQSLEESSQKQVNVPLVDMTTLIFYSGNIVIDMILNTLFAVPEIVSLGVNIVFGFFPINAVIQAWMNIFIFVLIFSIYVISILAFVMDLRSGSANIA